MTVVQPRRRMRVVWPAVAVLAFLLVPLGIHAAIPAAIHYLPQADRTVAPAARGIHQAVWREHLAALGLAATFHDQVAPADDATPGRGTPTRLARVVRQRQDLVRGQERLADLLARLDVARAELGRARIRADDEERGLALRWTELRVQDTAERRRLSAERAETARLKSALAGGAQDSER